MKSNMFSIHADLQANGNASSLRAKLVSIGGRKVPTEADFDSATGELKALREDSSKSTPLILSREEVSVHPFSVLVVSSC